MPLKELRPWKTLSKTTLLEHSKFLTVENHTVELPDGQVIADWPWLITPNAVIILAETEDGKFLVFRQVKYGIDGPTLAPVGGYIEPAEDPDEAAKRELLEETGYVSDDWVSLGSYLVSPNRGFATHHLYHARRSRKVAEPDSDDLEEQQLFHLNRAELRAALLGGDIHVLAWAMTAAMVLLG
jgi:ADP-ribose pyrophosphatase